MRQGVRRPGQEEATAAANGNAGAKVPRLHRVRAHAIRERSNGEGARPEAHETCAEGVRLDRGVIGRADGTRLPIRHAEAAEWKFCDRLRAADGSLHVHRNREEEIWRRGKTRLASIRKRGTVVRRASPDEAGILLMREL